MYYVLWSIIIFWGERTHCVCIFQSRVFHPCIFDGPAFSSPAFSVAPEKSHRKGHAHSSKVQLIILRHCLKAFFFNDIFIAGISNVTNVWNLWTKVNNNYRTRRKQIRRYHVIVMWLQETLLLAATILPHEYFLTCLKACNYCSVLHAKIACNYCPWNHFFSKQTLSTLLLFGIGSEFGHSHATTCTLWWHYW